MALQTAHLLGAWLDGEQDPNQFLPKWPDVQEMQKPQNEAEQRLANFGLTQRMNW